MSEFAKRVAFAVAAIPVVAWCVWAGGAPLTVLLSIAAALGAWEYARLAEAAGTRPMSKWTIVLSALIPIMLHAVRLGYAVPGIAWIAMLVPVLLSMALWRRGSEGRPIEAVATTLFGVWYTGGMLAFVYALRYHRFAVTALAGSLLVALPVVLTWLNDSGAFFFGKRFGKKKLMPSVSPGKTWAGAWGALGTTVVATWAIVQFVLVPFAGLGMRLWGVLVFGIAMSVAAQVGDLVESMLKRQAGVKDSSALIPGHGGVLDRVDSLLFTVPIAYVMLEVLLVVAA
ncbi:MAG: phosphatidate cytidylyltransferase [Gemmatimonadaceae bacterium]|nr:phosphatidate cytidylyltransferase [Gemmatimonadaceae bacterium]